VRTGRAVHHQRRRIDRAGKSGTYLRYRDKLTRPEPERIDNLRDKHAYLENVAELGLTNAVYNRVATNQPSTIGVDLDYRY
jgi:hypothetical protein